MHLLVSAAESEAILLDELRRGFPAGAHEIITPGLIQTDLPTGADGPPLLAFAKQLLPKATSQHAASINAWSQRLADVALAQLPDGWPWLLHVVPHYGSGTAGLNRCRLIREALRGQLQRKRRRLLKQLRDDCAPFSPEDSLLQLLLVAPDRGFVSIAPAPRPHGLRRLLSPFPKGLISEAGDKAAPSRAFSKLIEAEQRLGIRIGAGETVVDLGASPGSWSYVALQRGANVVAVDRSPLRDDLMRDRRLTFRQGDAFTFQPDTPVDWLICDVIAAPRRSIDLLLDWARARRCRRFVVTIKFKGHGEYAVLEELKQALPPLCDEFFLTRLCANKNETCAFGVVAGRPAV